MEFKKKTIIWEDNNEPPKDYIWAKKDGKFYEYSYITKSWIESKLIKAEESGGSGGSDGGGDSVDINTILDNISIKDDLLTKLQAIDYTNQGEEGVLTDLTFDDVFNDYNDFIKSWLYREELPSINVIQFSPFANGFLEKFDVNIIGFVILDRPYTYNVNVVNDDNNIKIYAKQNAGGAPI